MIGIIKLLIMQFGLDMRNTFAKLQINDRQDSPSKRKAKIFSNKLPQDFFGTRIYALSELKNKPHHRQEIKTQRLHRKPTLVERTSQTRDTALRQGSLTTRIRKQAPVPTTINLIMGIIQSTRHINKEIDRHSLQLKKQNKIYNNPESMKVQLPPLQLRKGVSLN